MFLNTFFSTACLPCPPPPPPLPSGPVQPGHSSFSGRSCGTGKERRKWSHQRRFEKWRRRNKFVFKKKKKKISPSPSSFDDWRLRLSLKTLIRFGVGNCMPQQPFSTFTSVSFCMGEGGCLCQKDVPHRHFPDIQNDRRRKQKPTLLHSTQPKKGTNELDLG